MTRRRRARSPTSTGRPDDCSLHLVRPPALTSPSVIPDIPYIRGDGERRATYFELFFDLVYVFAATQLSHHLLGDLTWAGAAETGFLLVAVYWAWNYTTWMTNWFDPEVVPVRLVLVFVMLASLLVAASVPEAFGDHAWLFAGSYCALQVVRNAFVVAVTPPGDFHRNFVQILAWSVLSVPLWLGGAAVDGEGRWVLWLAALAVDLAGAADPVLGADDGSHAHGRVADRPRPLRRAVPALRHHRAGREHRDHGGDGVRRRSGRPGRRGPAVARSGRRWPCGGCTSGGSPPRRLAPTRSTTHPDRPGVTPTPTCTCRSWRASCCRPSATSWCSRTRPTGWGPPARSSPSAARPCTWSASPRSGGGSGGVTPAAGLAAAAGLMAAVPLAARADGLVVAVAVTIVLVALAATDGGLGRRHAHDATAGARPT